MLFYKIRVQKGVKVMKFSEFIYKRIDLEETKKKIQEITEKLKHAQSVEEQVQAVYEMNDVKKEIATADSLVYIRYTINTKDEFYAKEREYNDHIGPMLEEEIQKYNKVLLASPFRKELEEKLGKVLFINLELSMKDFLRRLRNCYRKKVHCRHSTSHCLQVHRLSSTEKNAICLS